MSSNVTVSYTLDFILFLFSSFPSFLVSGVNKDLTLLKFSTNGQSSTFGVFLFLRHEGYLLGCILSRMFPVGAKSSDRLVYDFKDGGQICDANFADVQH